ncbi:AAA family ATPase [Methyloceanibacter sp.]|uniref:AAA family ATPase n=1 Tax=Methyloceanibacter sp. TaxID=1965321 RepID=UPI002B6E5358|nr:AAA family ATPase [Methyloceanibacter sp.]HML91089.1 AAA family ATPase [Methyloceanibacter sp.]
MTQITAEDVRLPDPNKRFECPLCHASRGTSLALKNDRLVAHCHSSGCDVFAWIAEQGWLPRRARQRATQEQVSQEEVDAAKLRRAYIILRAAANANAGKPVDYLAARGIDVVPPGAMLMPREVSRKVLNRNFAAMVLPVCDKDGHLVGAQTTLLSRDGTRRIRGGKRSYGSVKGGFVQLGAVDSKRPLIVAEGIETALAASQIAGGLPAIACLGTSNMKTVGIPECSEVVIAADPGEAGQEAATVLAERAVQYRPTRIATPPKGDWADALKEVYDDPESLLQLKRRLTKAKRFSDTPRLRAFTCEEWVALDIPPRQHFLNPVLPVAGATLLSGQKGNGKTRIVFAIAEAVATGSPILDWKSDIAGRVLYIDGELPQHTVQHRVSRLGPTDGNLAIISRYHQMDRGVRMGKLSDQSLRDEIDRVVEEGGFNVIILDSYSSLCGEDENDIEAWPQIEDWVMGHRGCGRSVLLIMHEGVEKGRARGRTKRWDQFDNTMRVEALKERHDEDEDWFYYLLEFTAVRDEGEDDNFLRRQIVRAPKGGHCSFEFIEVPESKKPGKTRNAERDQEIRKLADDGVSPKEIATMYGISRPRVVQICNSEE